MGLTMPAQRDVDLWQLHLWNAPEDTLSRPQKLQLMLMLEGAFNAFDPFVVVADLLAHRDLWHGVIMDRAWLVPEKLGGEYVRMATDLIKLRDISAHWNVDQLFIHTDPEHVARWQEVVKNWRADEVSVIEGEDIGHILGSYPTPHKIVSVWWD